MEPVFRRLLTSLGAGDDVGRIGKLFRELSVKEIHLRPYVEPLFERLHRPGVKLGIVSNTEALLTRFELDRFPILQAAEAIVLSSDVGVRKPDPEISHSSIISASQRSDHPVSEHGPLLALARRRSTVRIE